MENYEQMLGMGAPMSSAMRSLTPSILAKRQIRQGLPDLSQFLPREPQMQMPGGGLGSLTDIAKMLMGRTFEEDKGSSVPASLLGGI